MDTITHTVPTCFAVGSPLASLVIGIVFRRSACDNLRCTDCNFKVILFSGKVWDPATDYMFLRNNAPDPIKLGTRLQPSSGDHRQDFVRYDNSASA